MLQLQLKKHKISRDSDCKPPRISEEVYIVSQIVSGLISRYPLDNYDKLAKKAWKITDAILQEKDRRDTENRD